MLVLRLPSELLVAAFAAVATARPSTVDRRVVAMGTALELHVTAPTREAALRASEASLREIERVEQLLSTWRPGGPLYAVNVADPGEPVEVPEELLALLETVFSWTARSAGAFDATVLPLVRAWDLRGLGRIPTAGERHEATTATGRSRFVLDRATHTVLRLSREAGIDEGAWGKGYALDRAALQLRAAGVLRALLDLGGQALALEEGAGKSFEVGIAHPRNRESAALRIRLQNASVATSGNSERSREADGARLGHILDPRTGCPASDFGSVSVVAASGLVADILSTAFFVLGPAEAMRLSSELRAQGFHHQALFLVLRESDSEPALDALMTPGFRQLVTWIDRKSIRDFEPHPISEGGHAP